MPTEQNKPNFARVISKQKKAKNKQKENRDKIINQKENKSITSQESDGERQKRKGAGGTTRGQSYHAK